MQKVRRICRHKDRKYYDHTTGWYTTLEEMRDLFLAGHNVLIYDLVKKVEITEEVLRRGLMEYERIFFEQFPVDLLKHMIKKCGNFSEYLRGLS